jgi:hypothetical protein
MSKALNKRIADAFSTIYDRGDRGLDYMDGHVGLNADLMQHFYDDTLEQLSKLERHMLANQLELVVADMQQDLEF